MQREGKSREYIMTRDCRCDVEGGRWRNHAGICEKGCIYLRCFLDSLRQFFHQLDLYQELLLAFYFLRYMPISRFLLLLQPISRYFFMPKMTKLIVQTPAYDPAVSHRALRNQSGTKTTRQCIFSRRTSVRKEDKKSNQPSAVRVLFGSVSLAQFGSVRVPACKSGSFGSVRRSRN